MPALTAGIIRRQIEGGRWRDWLPGERRLAQELRVSRGTVRAALAILAAGQSVRAVSSRGHRVASRRRRRDQGEGRTVIGLLSPEPIETRRPYFALLLAHLREAVAARGWTLQRHSGESFFGAQAAAHLERLVNQSSCAAWMLFHSTAAAQSWFRERGLPALVAGHNYEGIDLPSLDTDHRAAGRHAGLLLARHRHRDVALVVSRRRLPGLVEGEAGFNTGFNAGAGRDAATITRLPNDADPAALAAAVTRCLRRRPRPTAIVVEDPNQYLTVFSAVTALGLAVPTDVSLISRLDDPFLAHLVPPPARYRVEPAAFSRALMGLLARLTTREPLPSRGRKIVPDFIAGGSVSAPRPQASAHR